jgi:hypothetical protein
VTGITGEGTVTLAVVKKLRVIDLRALSQSCLEKKNSRKGAKAQSLPGSKRNAFAPLRLCGRNLFPHLMSLRLNEGNSAIAK